MSVEDFKCNGCFWNLSKIPIMLENMPQKNDKYLEPLVQGEIFPALA